MSNIFFCADLHFGHNQPFLYEGRGFSSIEEHDEIIVERHNSLVKPNDIVYCLGDIMLNNNKTGMEHFNRLNGNFYVIIGNHDTDVRIKTYQKTLGSWINGIHQLKSVDWGNRFTHKKKEFFLSHFPSLVVNEHMRKPVFNIHGHQHDTVHFHSYIPNGYEVSLDTNNCYPISFDTILEDLKTYKERFDLYEK